MKLTEALGILKKNGAIISEANKVDAGYDHRGWARYGFNSPNKNRGYVKMLNFLYHAENGMTKKMIHNWLGLSTAPGNHSATWTEMSDAGLAKYDKHEQVWNITAKGRKYLEDNDLVIPLEDLTDPGNETAGDSDSAKYLKKELVKIVSNASGLAAGGLTRQEIAKALDITVAETVPFIRACMEAGEIEWDDDAGVFKAVAVKKPEVADPDDDMYDDTPIVKQRDESFIGFLKQHGYCLTEAYDAVTDRNNIKDNRQINQSYLTKLMRRLKNALEERGIDSSLTNNCYGLKIGKCKVTLYNDENVYRDIGRYGDDTIGPESDDDAGYSQMENSVILRFWGTTHLLPVEKAFDVRNTPGMVQWILDNMER